MVNKAQMRIGESIIILFIFIIFIAVGFSFYSKVNRSSFQAQFDESATMLAIETAQKVSLLPELQCSSGNIEVKNCFDIMKVSILAGLQSDTEVVEHYFDVFGPSTITIKRIYPESEPGEESSWTIYNQPPQTFTRRIPTQIPILLYDAKEKSYYFGALDVRYFVEG